MPSSILQDYMYRQIASGVARGDIKKVLMEKGWQESDIDEVFQKRASSRPVLVTSLEKENNKNIPLVNLPIKKKKLSVKGSVFLFTSFLLIIGISIVGYFYIYLAPEKVVKRSLTKMRTIKTFQYSGQIDIQLPNSANEKGSFSKNAGNLLMGDSLGTYTLAFLGDVDLTDFEKGGFSTMLDLKNDDTLLVEVEIRNKEKASYLNVHHLGGSEIIDTSMFTNRWVKFDLTKMAEQLNPDKTELVLTKEEMEELGEVLSQDPPFEVMEKLTSEKINGQPNFHYKFKVNQVNLSQLVTKAVELATGEKTTEERKRNIAQILAKFDFSDGEIWIGKEDLFIDKLKFGLRMKDEETEEAKVSLNLEFSLTSFNLPINVEIPSDYSTFEEIIKEIFGEIELSKEVEEIPIETRELLLPN